MRPVKTTRQFERDLRMSRKRGKNLSRLWVVVETLARGVPLNPRHRRHKLSGEWRDFWECHVEPDWLLIWRDETDAVVLVRLGTHSDLFG
jgi:mRNA interferase YafQ